MNSDTQKIEEALKEIGVYRFSGKQFTYFKDVLFKQTNVVGNTYFANYVEWQGEAREKFFLEHPSARAFLVANPHIILITYATYHRFLGSTYFGDRVRIEVTSGDITKHSFRLFFTYFRDSSGEKVGEGWQKVCFQDARNNQISPVPTIFLDLIEPVQKIGSVHLPTDF